MRTILSKIKNVSNTIKNTFLNLKTTLLMNYTSAQIKRFILIICCVASVCTIAILTYYIPIFIKEKKESTQTSEKQEKIYTGEDVKNSLDNWSPANPQAIVICSQEMLLTRHFTDTSYLIYFVTSNRKQGEEIINEENGDSYTLFGMNYGNILTETVLTDNGDGSYLSRYGLLSEDEEYTYRDDNGSYMVVTQRSSTHPYKTSDPDTIHIYGKEAFNKFNIYDVDGNKVGILYKTISINQDLEKKQGTTFQNKASWAFMILVILSGVITIVIYLNRHKLYSFFVLIKNNIFTKNRLRIKTSSIYNIIVIILFIVGLWIKDKHEFIKERLVREKKE